MHVELCRHLTVWRNMCAECGLDLREYVHSPLVQILLSYMREWSGVWCGRDCLLACLSITLDYCGQNGSQVLVPNVPSFVDIK